MYEIDKLAFVVMVTKRFEEKWREKGGEEEGDCQRQNIQLVDHAECGPCLEKSEQFWVGRPRVFP